MKKALVVIDVQNDFIKGSLKVEGAEIVRDRIYEKCIDAVKSSVDLFLTKDCHGDDYNSLSEAKYFEKHCLYGTEGQQIDAKVSEFCDVAIEVINKGTMGSVNIVRALTERRYDEIEIVGFILEKCVFANAVMLKATDLRADIVVDASCTAVADAGKADEVINVMEDFGIKVIGKNNVLLEDKKTEKKQEEKVTEEKVTEEKVTEEKVTEEKVTEEKKPEEKKPEEKKPEEKVTEEKKPEEKVTEEKKPEEKVTEEKKTVKSGESAETAKLKKTGKSKKSAKAKKAKK